ncbi:hypothetical protein [uncultured Treponema sp.]|uniref:hypothetical protein n=1 Tax=uncultured Treponema sp. TaxID=162155 RepID=UPI0025D66A72|nr:hypothetical protein [uncultured Treponema sp.]
MLDFGIDDIKDAFSDFAHEKPVLLAVVILIVFLFLAGLTILMIQTTPEKKVQQITQEPFTQDAPVLIPDAPDIEKEYYPNRITENQWSNEEVNKWFTFPEDETMTELEKANDKIINDITSSAP